MKLNTTDSFAAVEQPPRFREWQENMPLPRCAPIPPLPAVELPKNRGWMGCIMASCEMTGRATESRKRGDFKKAIIQLLAASRLRKWANCRH